MDEWQFIAFKLAERVSKNLNIELTHEFVTAMHEEFINISKEYIDSINFTIINNDMRKDIEDKMAELAKKRYVTNAQPLNSSVDVILSKSDKHDSSRS